MLVCVFYSLNSVQWVGWPCLQPPWGSPDCLSSGFGVDGLWPWATRQNWLATYMILCIGVWDGLVANDSYGIGMMFLNTLVKLQTQISLILRLLPSFLLHTVQKKKNKERAWMIWSRVWWHTMRGLGDQIIAHACCLRAFSRARDRVALLIVTVLDAAQDDRKES